MKPSNIRLIAIDIDDTLLTSTGMLLPSVVSAVKRAQAAGIMVTLATGRTYPIAAPIAERLDLTTPLITNNGAVVRSRRSVHHHWPIARDMAVCVYSAAVAHGLTPLFFQGDGVYAEARDERTDYYVSLGGMPPGFVGDAPRWLDTLTAADEVSNILLIGEPGAASSLLPELQAQFAGRLQITLSKPGLIEVTAHGVSKWKALSALAGELAIAREHIMAIGDSLNDLEMLQRAGIGVAVANAPARVRKAADFVVPSHDEGGVAVAVQMCLNGRLEP